MALSTSLGQNTAAPLADQLVEYVYDKAKAVGLIDEQTLEAYKALELSAARYDGPARNGVKEERLQDAIQSAAQLTDDQKLAISRVMSAKTILINGLYNMDRARAVQEPYEKFVTLFKNRLTQGNPEEFVSLLKETHDKMLLSIVQTMHPTIYHNEFGRHAEGELTVALEDLRTGTQRMEAVSPRGSKPFENATKVLDRVLEGLAQGKSVTHDTQVTVSQENKVEFENFDAIRTAFIKVKDEYNRALRTIINPDELPEPKDASKRLLTPKERSQIKAIMNDSSIQVEGQPLRIALLNYEMNDSKMELRTWARSADADGRDKATSIELSRAVEDGVNKQTGKYEGPKLDLRENQGPHRDCVSALIQVAYQRSMGLQSWNSKNADEVKKYEKSRAFQKFCTDFADTHETGGNPSWTNAQESIFQQMTPENQTIFLKGLIINDFNLVPSHQKDDTLEFTRLFYQEFKTLIHEDKSIPGEESPHAAIERVFPHLKDHVDDISLENLKMVTVRMGKEDEPRSLFQVLRERIREREVGMQVHGSEKGEHFILNRDGSYERDHNGWSQALFADLKTGEKVVDEKGNETIKAVPLITEDRKKLLDVVKRLQIIDDATERHGENVADRYQIANFEKSADFYALLLLFKQTGILKIEDGKVAAEPKPKLAIQPLLETAPDMAEAPKLFTELLNDPLALSYYQARGNKADIMLGFSDGSKSAGNFASERAIFECAQKLHHVFAEKGIALRVFQGRGRGPDRGGHFEEGQAARLMPPEVQRDMILDETMQSDKPMDMRISPSAARDAISSLVVGTMTARQEADKYYPVSHETGDDADRQLKSMASMEAAMTNIAAASEARYKELVSQNPDTLKFLGGIHDNPDKSSRAAARSTGKKTFDGTRAITVEYGFNLADAPLHNIGLKGALQAFAEEGGEVLDKNGNTVKGAQALEALYDGNPLFKAMMDKIKRGMENYDPVIFQNYGKKLGVESWAKECAADLNGLEAVIDTIRSKTQTQRSVLPVSEDAKSSLVASQERRPNGVRRVVAEREHPALIALSNRNDTLAHVLALSSDSLKPKTFKDKEIMGNLVFAAARHVSHRGIPADITASVMGDASWPQGQASRGR